MFSFFRGAVRQNYLKYKHFSILANKSGNCAETQAKTTKAITEFSQSSLLNTAASTINHSEHLLVNFNRRQQYVTTAIINSSKNTQNMENKNEKITVNKEELKKRLTPLQYQVTQEAATERPFTGCYNKFYEKGVYQCIVCHQDLFSSDTKYDSGCGWPAFNDVLDKGKVTLHRDASIPDRIRTEVRCSKCSAHMGHVFEDGPKPTRKRYCINSAAIEFIPADELNKRAAASSSSASSAAQTVVTGAPIAQQ